MTTENNTLKTLGISLTSIRFGIIVTLIKTANQQVTSDNIDVLNELHASLMTADHAIESIARGINDCVAAFGAIEGCSQNIGENGYIRFKPEFAAILDEELENLLSAKCGLRELIGFIERIGVMSLSYSALKCFEDIKGIDVPWQSNHDTPHTLDMEQLRTSIRAIVDKLGQWKAHFGTAAVEENMAVLDRVMELKSHWEANFKGLLDEHIKGVHNGDIKPQGARSTAKRLVALLKSLVLTGDEATQCTGIREASDNQDIKQNQKIQGLRKMTEINAKTILNGVLSTFIKDAEKQLDSDDPIILSNLSKQLRNALHDTEAVWSRLTTCVTMLNQVSTSAYKFEAYRGNERFSQFLDETAKASDSVDLISYGGFISTLIEHASDFSAFACFDKNTDHKADAESHIKASIIAHEARQLDAAQLKEGIRSLISELKRCERHIKDNVTWEIIGLIDQMSTVNSILKREFISYLKECLAYIKTGKSFTGWQRTSEGIKGDFECFVEYLKDEFTLSV